MYLNPKGFHLRDKGTKAKKPHLDTDICLGQKAILHNAHLSRNEAAMSSQPTTSNFPLMEATAGTTAGIAHSDSEVSIFTHKLTDIQVLRWAQMNAHY